MASSLEHKIWSNLCSQAIGTHIWLHNKLTLFPFKVRLVSLFNYNNKNRTKLKSLGTVATSLLVDPSYQVMR